MGFSFNGATFKGEVELSEGAPLRNVPISTKTEIKGGVTGNFTYSVPEGKIWTIISITNHLNGTGTAKVGTNGGEIFNNQSAGTTQTCNPYIVLEHGDSFYMNATTSARYSSVTYYEEDV